MQDFFCMQDSFRSKKIKFKNHFDIQHYFSVLRTYKHVLHKILKSWIIIICFEQIYSTLHKILGKTHLTIQDSRDQAARLGSDLT